MPSVTALVIAEQYEWWQVTRRKEMGVTLENENRL